MPLPSVRQYSGPITFVLHRCLTCHFKQPRTKGDLKKLVLGEASELAHPLRAMESLLPSVLEAKARELGWSRDWDELYDVELGSANFRNESGELTAQLKRELAALRAEVDTRLRASASGSTASGTAAGATTATGSTSEQAAAAEDDPGDAPPSIEEAVAAAEAAAAAALGDA